MLCRWYSGVVQKYNGNVMPQCGTIKSITESERVKDF